MTRRGFGASKALFSWPLVYITNLLFLYGLATLLTLLLLFQDCTCDDRPAYVPKRMRTGYPRFILQLAAWILGWAHAFFNRIDSFIMSLHTRKKQKPTAVSKSTRHYYVRAYRRSTATHLRKRTSYIVYKSGVRSCHNNVAYKHFWQRARSQQRRYLSDPNLRHWLSLTSFKRKVSLPLQWDTDSHLIGIDTMSTACMTNDAKDFVGTVTAVSRSIRGLKGSTKVTKMGTVRWSITDDLGETHILNIKNVFLCETLPFRILSPQHWDRMLKGNNKGRAKSLTNGEETVIMWNGAITGPQPPL